MVLPSFALFFMHPKMPCLETAEWKRVRVGKLANSANAESHQMSGCLKIFRFADHFPGVLEGPRLATGHQA
jgi:hypothetical protein